ncbi:MAG: purine-nucleoside phosphorylase [Acidobacteria bacterium]|nr:MAG: purine-nucleoside phosphorylase [Acidobacteriota bacterium]REK04215.1 MAG: purine-nucleoside phosphorylase [Acidobacteriota bacterium]REK15476.1 MAG: purine-nucleoside phosphorylase [Acidobacteriota bacterium]REK46467.1 MAG: purine-nucleoside phosphorylase [Acidobacteriota bacterium]
MQYERAAEAAEFIKERYPQKIDVALVLGSGLGGFAESVEDPVVIPYDEIPHFPESTVEGHAGQLVIGKIGEVSVAIQQGRFHYYEGYDIADVVLPMRVFGLLGIETVILTNAAGSVLTTFKRGRLMLIRDHINLMGVSPLRGQNDERFGPRFPDMTHVYDIRLQEIAKEEAAAIAEKRYKKGKTKKVKTLLRRGVYCALSGPNYETPSEIRMYRQLGATAVGMSTVPEAITARHQGMRVLGISCISNLAAGITGEEIDHSEVMEAGDKVAKVFQKLLHRILKRLGEEGRAEDASTARAG